MDETRDTREKALIFGSYNRKDIKVVEAIQGKLQSHGISLWLDTRELKPGMEWLAEVEDAISRSRAAVIFKGPDGFGNFQRQEVSALFKLHADQKLTVIPALLPGASGKDAGIFLGNLQHVDFRLRNPDPFGGMISALAQYAPPKLAAAHPSILDPRSAHPLVQWIVNEISSLGEIEHYGRQYISARRWAESLYIYHRLASLAMVRSNRAYADSYLQIGRIYWLAGERSRAEKKWEISLRIYQDYYPGEMRKLLQQLDAFRSTGVEYSPAG